MAETFLNLGKSINGSFFLVLNKIISLQAFFMDEASNLGWIVLTISLFTAGLNYALTQQGLKENLIKIMKATLFFLIVIAAYPRVIGWITGYAYQLAYNSVGGSVKKYFDGVTDDRSIVVSESFSKMPEINFQPLSRQIFQSTPERGKIFSDMTVQDSVAVNNTNLSYTAIAPAAAIQVILLLAQEAFDFAEDAKISKSLGPFTFEFPDFARVIKGLICGFFLIMTGVFALLEYLMCLLEFMLVASVGVLLFPLSIWDGSKFLSEKFIGAIVGFFMKLLFCNLAIFLLLYGFISMFATLDEQGFTGKPDQFCFIVFTCLLFFYICKSAPGIAQSLLTGTPSLSATGAISAATGAVAAATAVGGAVGGAVQKPIAATASAGAKAGGAASEVIKQGGKAGDAAKAFAGSMAKSAGAGLLNKSLGLGKGGIEQSNREGHKAGAAKMEQKRAAHIADMQESKGNAQSLGLLGPDGASSGGSASGGGASGGGAGGGGGGGGGGSG